MRAARAGGDTQARKTTAEQLAKKLDTKTNKQIFRRENIRATASKLQQATIKNCAEKSHIPAKAKQSNRIYVISQDGADPCSELMDRCGVSHIKLLTPRTGDDVDKPTCAEGSAYLRSQNILDLSTKENVV